MNNYLMTMNNRNRNNYDNYNDNYNNNKNDNNDDKNFILQNIDLIIGIVIIILILYIKTRYSLCCMCRRPFKKLSKDGIQKLAQKLNIDPSAVVHSAACKKCRNKH